MSTIILAVIIVLFFDGAVAAAEAAFFSARRDRMAMLAERDLRAKIFLSLKEKSERSIAALTALSSFITILGSVVVGAAAARRFGSWQIAAISAVFTFVVVVFAEILPKKLGERFAEQISLFAAPPLRAVSSLFDPLASLVNYLARPFGPQKKSRTVSEEEISLMARIGSREGAIEEGESQLIDRIFKLNDITAGDIMTPRPRVEFIDGNQALGEAREEITVSRHSRLPVFDGTRDNVIGVAHQRDLLRALASGEDAHLVREYAKAKLVVPESRLADDLLHDFQQKKTHLAVVADEHGGVAGVVGLEDVLEELVGEIIDEKEVAPETIKRLSKNEIVVHGQTKIETLNAFFNADIKSKKTVNGFLLAKLKRMPQKGEELAVGDLKFLIEEIGENAVAKVKVRREEAPAAPEQR